MSQPTLVTNTNEVRIQQVQKHVTIFELLARMGIDLPEATQQIKCPFHDDHSPSARVYSEQNKIYCFTEQKGWDVVDAAQAYLQTPSMSEALTWLEQEFAVPSLTQTLSSTIRTQLTQRVNPSIRDSAALIEQRLYAVRKKLGFERYTRLLAGLDLTVWEFSERRIKFDDVNTRFAKLLEAART